YHPEAEISVTQKVDSGNPKATRKREDLAVIYDAKQKPGSENNGTDKNLQINQGAVKQFEPSEHKFKRLMKESEECLKRSGKLI
ncbi:MAG TPA: hypothetical protein VKI61_18000, partial [Chitinophagaceae bacterium]|nr:hypothetical protein [Chitinophagaceae bacterium]